MNWLKHFSKVHATRDRELPAREIIKKAMATGYQPAQRFREHQEEVERKCKIRNKLAGGLLQTLRDRSKARSS